MAANPSTRNIPVETVRKLLRYDPETGHLYWRESRGRIAAGMIAGTVKSDRGYIAVRVNGITYYGHRLAWVLQTGEQIPEDREIDHRDGNPSNNAWENLRAASPVQNKRNMVPSSLNTSGATGVTYRKSRKKWQAQMSVGNKLKYLGSFDTKEDAIAARQRAEREVFGEFAYSERPAT